MTYASREACAPATQSLPAQTARQIASEALIPLEFRGLSVHAPVHAKSVTQRRNRQPVVRRVAVIVDLWQESKVFSEPANHITNLFTWLWEFSFVILNRCTIYRQHALHCVGRFLSARYDANFICDLICECQLIPESKRTFSALFVVCPSPPRYLACD
jgi:hypothetical protein